MCLPMYKIIVVNTTDPIIQLKYDKKNTTAIIMSIMVGPMLKSICDNKLLVESVPRSIILKTSPVLRLRCHFKLNPCK